MGKPKGNKGNDFATGGTIPKPPKVEDLYVSFSFKYLDLKSNVKFTIHQCDDPRDYIEKLLERLKAIEGMKINDFRFSGSDALRCHGINWDETSEKSGFSHLNQQLKANTPWQFNISLHAHGRVHGFFVGNIFFVIWLDPKHRLYGG